MSVHRPTSAQADLGQRNRGLALALVAQVGPVTRSTLANLIGVTRPAVSRIISELIGSGWLVEAAPRPGVGPGRPSSSVQLAPGQRLIFGIDLRLDGVRIQTRDLAGSLLGDSSHALMIDATTEEALDVIVRQIRAEQSRLGLPTLCIGLAVGAAIDETNRVIIDSQYRPWRQFPIADMLAQRLGMEPSLVVMRDVATSAALANWQQLAGDPGMSDLVHLQMGFGSGAGVVRRRSGVPMLDTQPRMAHIPLRVDGARCTCGAHGCVDATAGFWALVARARGAGVVAHEGPQMIEDYCAEIVALADSGDQVAIDSIDEMAFWFSRIASMLINIRRPSRFTYAGYPALLGRRFHERFVAELVQSVHELDHMLVTTELADRASVVGAYWLAVNQLIEDSVFDKLAVAV
ncbi:ROK family protein [Microbacterium sp. Au-Mic1]|uniref:ROK family transcriptional regulator n=1 Tax=Microbacterium sp. Au-Mic1 TaxID=2906457 RepID=UPI001E49240E|nr:ROK family transcriptional regulator [Microbacterium sp. Au-Mic1]MCE4026245.1 ROK family protein [Microbacterium sp. Au-Mic1]